MGKGADCKTLILLIPKGQTDRAAGPATIHNFKGRYESSKTTGVIRTEIRALQLWRKVCRAVLNEAEKEQNLYAMGYNKGHLKVLDDVIPILADLAERMERDEENLSDEDVARLERLAMVGSQDADAKK